MWEMLQEMVYKTHITDLELSTMPLINGCRNGDMIQLGPFHSQSLFQFVQITETYFFTLSLAIFLTCCNQVDSNLANLGPQLKWDKLLSLFLLPLMVARVRQALQVAQGSVETSFK